MKASESDCARARHLGMTLEEFVARREELRRQVEANKALERIAGTGGVRDCRKRI